MPRRARNRAEVRVSGAAVGVQLLLELPIGGPTEEEVLRTAAGRGVRIAGMRAAWQDDRPTRPGGIAVGYATPAAHAWSDALDALIDVLRTAVPAHAPGLRRRGPSTGGVGGSGVRQPKPGT
ncbi:hypothetical protein K1T35_30230 [Pseudonocardia sp. DSM 110487]|uniref:hypothetical protein n=1 Tax=Pseudonocardia sp. DSM 110487 TaxID=2865833 RepID=UPI001C6A6950|nr:hypothetical protein [Pseudonocardia sp. DSM 110487]QYN32823.1 hypothetical protein K1T35_30230 [Pseudonocardia sp. DSM 110487]